MQQKIRGRCDSNRAARDSQMSVWRESKGRDDYQGTPPYSLHLRDVMTKGEDALVFDYIANGNSLVHVIDNN